jgi:hypothetical protein
VIDYKLQQKAVVRAFKALGFKCIGFKHKFASGPDCYAVGKNRCMSVEIKQTRNNGKRTIIVDKVDKKRKNDDVVAIIINDYVLIEPMADHLQRCAPSGVRYLSNLGDF